MIVEFKNNKPFVEGVSLDEITNSLQTPFYIYSQNKIIEAYNKIKNSINAEIFYAIKANSNQSIISIIKNLGGGADVVSIGEVKRALHAGIPPHKIIFEGVGKSTDDIKFAIKSKIKQINIESIEELNLLDMSAKSIGEIQTIGIRINPDIDAQTNDKISTGRKTDKFGISFKNLQEACVIIKNLNNISLKGISCHIGSQIHDLSIYEKMFKKINEAVKITSSNGFQIESIDLGGGFGVTYHNEKDLDLKKISNLIKNNFDYNKFNISIEPGRYLVANSGILITKILTKKNNGDINFLITDAGMQTFIRPAMYKTFHNILALSQNNQKKEKYTVAGPICESSDIFIENIELPKQNIGNYLAICDVGAYGFVMASNYNTRNLPAEILIHNDKFEIIRQSEDLAKIIEKDIVPKWLTT